MEENPYQAPQSGPVAVGVLSGSRDELRSVASFQKGILVCILIYFIAVFGQIGLPPEARPLLMFGVLLVGVIGAIFVLLLAIKVYGIGLGIVLGILSLFPLIGLLVLLAVNSKATGILKQNGITVGLLGAKLSSV